jgi:hypothetical protein
MKYEDPKEPQLTQLFVPKSVVNSHQIILDPASY